MFYCWNLIYFLTILFDCEKPMRAGKKASWKGQQPLRLYGKVCDGFCRWDWHTRCTCKCLARTLIFSSPKFTQIYQQRLKSHSWVAALPNSRRINRELTWHLWPVNIKCETEGIKQAAGVRMVLLSITTCCAKATWLPEPLSPAPSSHSSVLTGLTQERAACYLPPCTVLGA